MAYKLPSPTFRFRLYQASCTARRVGAAVRHWLPSQWPGRGHSVRNCIGVYLLCHTVPAPAWAWAWAMEE